MMKSYRWFNKSYQDKSYLALIWHLFVVYCTSVHAKLNPVLYFCKFVNRQAQGIPYRQETVINRRHIKNTNMPLRAGDRFSQNEGQIGKPFGGDVYDFVHCLVSGQWPARFPKNDVFSDFLAQVIMSCSVLRYAAQVRPF